MTKTITFKKQGNGQDSWIIRYLDDNGKDEQLPEIVFEDPSIVKKIKLDNIDIDSMSSEDLQKLAQKLKPLLK